MRSSRRAAGFLLVAMIALAACDPVDSTTTPQPTPTAPTSTTPAPTESRPASGVATQVGQTDTDWGRIWDGLPNGFPRYPGSTAGDEGAAGPASGIILVQTADAKGIATFFQTALENAGYTTDGLSGPLEDGGYVLDMTGPTDGCKLQVTAAPTGGLTTVTILYGAACPFG
jgi:hypothetical protein